MSKLYLIGSMKNNYLPRLAEELRMDTGHEVFDDWFSPGPEADDQWQAYEKLRGRSYAEALYGHHAKTVFEFDKRHLDACDTGVLVLPAGKSAHLELGYLIGKGKKGYVFFPYGEPERYDIMYQFATGTVFTYDELVEVLK